MFFSATREIFRNLVRPNTDLRSYKLQATEPQNYKPEKVTLITWHTLPPKLATLFLKSRVDSTYINHITASSSCI